MKPSTSEQIGKALCRVGVHEWRYCCTYDIGEHLQCTRCWADSWGGEVEPAEDDDDE